jgi:tetratricopeptide (TPR) repeat protein
MGRTLFSLTREECPTMRHPKAVGRAVAVLLILGPFPASAQNGDGWIGQRIFTKFGTVLKVGKAVVDDEKKEASPSGGERRDQRLYRVQKVNGPWLWLVVEGQGVSGWVKVDQVVPYDQAIDYFTNELRAHPSSDTYNTRGAIWHEKHEYDIALGDFNEAIRLDPRNESAYYNRGLVRHLKKEYEKAIADYSEAIRLDPKFASAYDARGDAWNARKEYDKAISDYNDAIRLDPKYVSAYYDRGNVWRDRKRSDRAIADYSEAIRLDPKYVSAYVARGSALRATREYDRALSDFVEAIRLDPKYAWAYINRIVTYLVASRDFAVADVRNALDSSGWRDKNSLYLVIFGHFGLRRTHHEEEARGLLDEAAGRVNREIWPYPVVRFLRKEIDRKALLASATDNDKMTEAQVYLGLDSIVSGRSEEALPRLQWVKDNGTRSFIEYDIALAELDRIEGSKAALTGP